MGSFCSSKPQTTTQTQTYSANPAIQSAGTQALNMAESAASQPFQMPAAPVAGFNPFQTQAFNQYQGLQGGLEPYFNQATGDMQQGQTPVTQQDVASYMNPYASGALDNLKKYIFDPQRRTTMGNAVQSAGGVGADRLALTSQNLDKTQSDALTQAQAGFYSNALYAAQEAKQRALQSAQGWANLGLGKQSGQLQATGALAGAGAQQQALSQAQLMSPYQQKLAEIAYPYQNAQFLAGITGGLAPAFGGTTNGQATTTPAQPSMFSQIAGLGLSAAGLAGGFGFNPLSAFSGGGGASSAFPMLSGGGYYQNGNLVPGPGYAKGGTVDPEDFGRGFAVGGFTPDEYENSGNPFDSVTSTGAPSWGNTPGRSSPLSIGWPRGPALTNSQATWVPPTIPPKRFNYVTNTPLPPIQVPPVLPVEEPSTVGAPSSITQPPQAFPFQVPPNAGSMPILGAQLGQVPPISAPQASPIPPSTPVAAGAPRGAGVSVNRMPNQDLNVQDFMMPQDQKPYPDATNRDWGQNLTRSPWMALVNAGAKMMQSTKSGIGGLGEGIEAGASTLDKQRTELRSEQQINQRADELYRHAKSELNKYTRKTPHELASESLAERRLEQEKYQWQPGTGIDPATGQMTSGAYRLPTRSGEQPQFIPGATITGRGGMGPTALQKNIEYFAANNLVPGSTIEERRQNAANMLRESVNNPAIFERLVQSQQKFLSTQPEWLAKSPDEIRAKARSDIRAGQMAAAPPIATGATPETAIPDPGDGNRVNGMWYINPVSGKPDRWVKR